MRSLLLYAIVLVPFISNGQKVFFEPKDSVPGNFSIFSVDNFGRIYTVNKDEIFCWSDQGQKLFTTSLKTVFPTSIESSKSFRSLVFDQERSVVHFLDNTLTDIYGQIDLMALDFQQPWLVCESFAGNTFWVYDAGAMRLVKLDASLTTISITENLVSVFGNQDLPVQMREFNDHLFMVIPDNGVVVFDVFGTYLNRIDDKEALWVDVFGGFLLILNANGIDAYPLETIRDKFQAPFFTYPLPYTVKSFATTKNRFYLHTDNGVVSGVYKKKKEE